MSEITARLFAMQDAVYRRMVYGCHRSAGQRAAANISLLADLMGHESIETTRIYLRRTSTGQQAIVDRVVTW